MYKARAGPLGGVTEGKVFIIHVRERAAKDIWKSPEQRDK